MRNAKTATVFVFAAFAVALAPALGEKSQTAAAPTERADLGDFKRPVDPYEMLKELLNDGAAHRADAALSFELFEQYGDREDVLFLDAEVRNNFNEPICIPSIFFDSYEIIKTDIIFSVRAGDNGKIFPINIPPQIPWPTSQYVILMPGAAERVSFDLSGTYPIKNEDSLSVSYSFPAFFCRVMMSAYPVTQSMIDKPVGLSRLRPIAAVGSEDVIIFSGEAAFP